MKKPGTAVTVIIAVFTVAAVLAARPAHPVRPTPSAGPAYRNGPPSVWGDSLTFLALPALLQRGAKVHALGGTAPCDWLPQFSAGLVADRPSRVLLAFVGNVGTPCMHGVTTAAALATRYRRDLGAMVAIATRHRIPVTLIVPPYMDPNRAFYLDLLGAPQLGQMECAYAATDPSWLRCDTHARDALAIDGKFAGSFGDTQVRTPDGVHLTPYGARLYAVAILAAATAPGT
jgi:hypothetical protein